MEATENWSKSSWKARIATSEEVENMHFWMLNRVPFRGSKEVAR